MSDPEKFACSVPGCGFAATADRMWNLDRRATGGKLVVVCGKHAAFARGENGLRAYRLDKTLAFDAERAAKRLAEARAAREFLASFNRRENARWRGNGQPQPPVSSSRRPVQVE